MFSDQWEITITDYHSPVEMWTEENFKSITRRVGVGKGEGRFKGKMPWVFGGYQIIDGRLLSKYSIEELSPQIVSWSQEQWVKLVGQRV